jgi:hypothetical protein
VSALEPRQELNYLPLIVHFVVMEESASFEDILKFVKSKVGNRVSADAVFAAVSKLQEYNILKLNKDTTGTFSLQDWEPTDTV